MKSLNLWAAAAALFGVVSSASAQDSTPILEIDPIMRLPIKCDPYYGPPPGYDVTSPGLEPEPVFGTPIMGDPCGCFEGPPKMAGSPLDGYDDPPMKLPIICGPPPPIFLPIEPEPEPTIDVTGLVGGSATSANNAAGAALGQSLRDRGDESGVQASQNRLSFVSISDRGDSNLTAWGEINATNFDGSLDGHGGAITFGIDTKIGQNFLIGLMASYGEYEFFVGGATVDSEALTFGPYISAAITDKYSFNAYALFGSPEYSALGTTVETDRVSGGISVDATYVLGMAEAHSYLSVSGFSEDVPATAPGGARTISSVIGAVGTRLDFAIGSATRPYLLLAAESIRYDDGTTTLNSFSPRVGVGVEHSFTNGSVSLGVEGGEVFDGARDISAKLGLNMSF